MGMLLLIAAVFAAETALHVQVWIAPEARIVMVFVMVPSRYVSSPKRERIATTIV